MKSSTVFEMHYSAILHELMIIACDTKVFSINKTSSKIKPQTSKNIFTSAPSPHPTKPVLNKLVFNHAKKRSPTWRIYICALISSISPNLSSTDQRSFNIMMVKQQRRLQRQQLNRPQYQSHHRNISNGQSCNSEKDESVGDVAWSQKANLS